MALVRQILDAGIDLETASLEKVRRSFDRLMQLFGGLDVDTQPVELPGVDSTPLQAEWVGDPSASSTVLYLHGGGYVIGSPRSHRALASRLATAAEARVLLLDYRLAPEHPLPAASDDAFTAYRWLLDQGDGPLAVAGDSAGGALTLLLGTRVVAADLPRPKALAVFSPWADFEAHTPSLLTANDPLLDRDDLLRMAGEALAGQSPRDPALTPLYADLTDLPPVLIQVGGDDGLLDDSYDLAARLAAAGVDATVDTWPYMIHVWHLFAGRLDEGARALRQAGVWLKNHLEN